MFIPLIILFFLLLLLFGWISWRWCWGWLGWLIPATLLIWILIFVTGLQRNWDGSYYFSCVLRQLIGEISGQVEVIRYPSLAAGGIQWGIAISTFAVTLSCIVVLFIQSCKGKKHCRLSVGLGLGVLFGSIVAGTSTVDCIIRQQLLLERQTALAEIRSHIAVAQNEKVPKTEILAYLQDCCKNCVVTYEHAEPGRKSIQYALDTMRKLSKK